MSNAFTRMMTGLKEAARHAHCTRFHVESHVTTKVGRYRFKTECLKCGRTSVVEDYGSWHEPIVPTKEK